MKKEKMITRMKKIQGGYEKMSGKWPKTAENG